MLRRFDRVSGNGSSDASSIAAPGDAFPLPCRLGFLISDTAGPSLAVHTAITTGMLPGCTVALVICNVTGAPGVEAARAARLRAVTLEGRGHEQCEHEEAIDALLRRMGVDLAWRTTGACSRAPLSDAGQGSS